MLKIKRQFSKRSKDIEGASESLRGIHSHAQKHTSKVPG